MQKYLRVAWKLWNRNCYVKCSLEEWMIMWSSVPFLLLILVFKIITFPYWIYKYLKEVE